LVLGLSLGKGLGLVLVIGLVLGLVLSIGLGGLVLLLGLFLWLKMGLEMRGQPGHLHHAGRRESPLRVCRFGGCGCFRRCNLRTGQSWGHGHKSWRGGRGGRGRLECWGCLENLVCLCS
jgi:hypothetical protein